MRAGCVAITVMAIGGCHLADSPELNCQAGSHSKNGVCVADDPVAANIVITASCDVQPNPFDIASGQTFQFVNQHDADHEIKGADGQVWTSVAKGQTSAYFQIVKKGSWDYTVSGCKGGTVVVE